jgi:predicted Zn-dependent peptidase
MNQASFPMICKSSLPNGITLMTESMAHVRSAAIGVWLKRGSRHETAGQWGLSHFIEHMLFKGTAHRTAEQLAEEVDSLGGHLDAFTSKEQACFHLKVLDEHVPRAVAILADLVMNPLFDAEEMAKEKKVICEEIKMVEDTPDDLVLEQLCSAMWPGHPLGRPILGDATSVRGFTRSELTGFFERTYCGKNLLVAVAGHIDHDDVLRLVEKEFSSLTPGSVEEVAAAPRTASTVVTRSKRELEQVHLCLGTAAYPQAHERRHAAYVLNTVLGGSLSSRLFQNIREKRGLAYAISSGLSAYSDAGSLSIYAGTSREAMDEVLGLIMAELRSLRDEPIPDEELQRAKDHLKGSLILALEGTGSRMHHLARQEMSFGRQFDESEIGAAIEAVDAEAALAVARDLFSGGVTLSVLGNLGSHRPSSEALVL